jgi:hypothetical protein
LGPTNLNPHVTAPYAALLFLTLFKDKFGLRAWKGHDWRVMDSLHEKGYISNPATKAKSVAFTEEGSKDLGCRKNCSKSFLH